MAAPEVGLDAMWPADVHHVRRTGWRAGWLVIDKQLEKTERCNGTLAELPASRHLYFRMVLSCLHGETELNSCPASMQQRDPMTMLIGMHILEVSGAERRGHEWNEDKCKPQGLGIDRTGS